MITRPLTYFSRYTEYLKRDVNSGNDNKYAVFKNGNQKNVFLRCMNIYLICIKKESISLLNKFNKLFQMVN